MAQSDGVVACMVNNASFTLGADCRDDSGFLEGGVAFLAVFPAELSPGQVEYLHANLAALRASMSQCAEVLA